MELATRTASWPSRRAAAGRPPAPPSGPGPPAPRAPPPPPPPPPPCPPGGREAGEPLRHRLREPRDDDGSGGLGEDRVRRGEDRRAGPLGRGPQGPGGGGGARRGRGR